MRILRLSLIFLVINLSTVALAQKGVPVDFCISGEEEQLFDLLNLIRSDYGKPELQLSASLSYVAKLHVDDLQNNHPDTSVCTLSSWSDKGEWKPCCYNKYVFDPDCMWDKPKELTSFRYRGYELASFFEENFTPDSVYRLWSDTKEALDMILTEGSYKSKKWICAGIGISQNYVCLWFAQRQDPTKSPEVCANSQKTDSSTIVKKEPGDSQYYLIYGSFNTMHDAKAKIKLLKKDGYDNCGIIEKNGKFRTYLESYGSLKEAMFAKDELPVKYQEAWIFKN